MEHITKQKAVTLAERSFWIASERWVKANNSGDPEVYAIFSDAADEATARGEARLATIGVTCTWPGLDPVYHYNGGTYYNADSLKSAMTAEEVTA